MDSQQNQQQPQQQKGTITIGGPKPQPAVNPQLMEILNEIRSYGVRTRSVEERVSNLRRSFQLNEQNVIEMNKRFNEDINDINSEIADLNRDIADIKNKIELIIKELTLTAKKEDVDVLSKYLDLWKPVSFVTHNEVRRVCIQLLYELGFNIKPESAEKPKTPEEEMDAHLAPEKPGDKNIS